MRGKAVYEEFGIGQTFIRQYNIQRVLSALELCQPLTRADIARMTDMSLASVTRIIGALNSLGLVEETGVGDSVGRGRRALGLRLFAAQLGAGYLTAALLNRLGRRARPVPVPGTPAGGADPPGLDRIVAEAAVTYLKLCGFVLYFRLLAAGCGLLLPGAWQVVPAMLLEVCTGCDYASRTGFAASSLCCAALSVQGASVLLQVRTICPREISLKPLLVGRLLHLPLSLGLFYLGLPEQAVETFSTMSGQVVPLHRVPPDCAVLVLLVICALVCRLCPGSGEILPRKQPPEKT